MVQIPREWFGTRAAGIWKCTLFDLSDRCAELFFSGFGAARNGDGLMGLPTICLRHQASLLACLLLTSKCRFSMPYFRIMLALLPEVWLYSLRLAACSTVERMYWLFLYRASVAVCIYTAKNALVNAVQGATLLTLPSDPDVWAAIPSQLLGALQLMLCCVSCAAEPRA